MDLEGMTWVGHMYQKFEAMCLEVEEVMYQDTVNFVENQVQTVSTNIKRFYSDVMQDLADPSKEQPMKVAVSDLPAKQCRDSAMHKFPKVVSRAEPKKVDVGGVVKSSKQPGIDRKTNRKPSLNRILCADNLCQPSRNASSHVADKIICGGARQCVEELSKQTKLLPTGNSEAPVKKHLSRESELSNEKLEAWDDLRTSSPISVEFTELDFTRESINEINNAGEVATSALNDAPSPRIIGNEETEMTLSFSGGSLAESYEQPDERSLDIMSSAVLDMETAQELDRVEVEESCHLVNGAELPFFPQKEKKHKAYKMRIRDAFSSRMRSARKQEYKQLVVSFGEHRESKQWPESSICETEWEIL